MGDSLLRVIVDLKDANFKLDGELKERAIQALSVRGPGARVIHPRFGIGTVIKPLGQYYIRVKFDNDRRDFYQYGPRHVAIHKLTSLDVIVQREIEKSM